MTPTRKRRLMAVLLILLAVGIAGTLGVFALQENLTYLHTPTDVRDGKAPIAARFRLGGVVLEKSVVRSTDSLKIEFAVTDRFNETRVQFEGILPDLFREGQSIIAMGKLDPSGRFMAEEVLAKHDETYMPKEVADAIAKAKLANKDPAP